MNTQKIKDSEIADITISSLPSRPTAPKSFGGRGYTASEMKAAFDRLPLFIIERLNSLIDDIGGVGEGSLASGVMTGIKSGHSLTDLFSDITSGSLSSYMTVLGQSLAEWITELDERLGENKSDDLGNEERLDELYRALDAIEERQSAGESLFARLDKDISEAIEYIRAGGLDHNNILIDCGSPEALADYTGGEF